MASMKDVIVPKSDQLNADDLIGGPRTIRITRVTIAPNGEQRVSVYFDGDNNKPWKPCKSMCRVMVAAWGLDANQYTGRSLTLYTEPKVKWGGLEVGGIRISHMSHIERDMLMALTETKGKRSPFEVKRLEVQKQATSKLDAMVDDLIDMVGSALSEEALAMFLASEKTSKQLGYLKDKHPQLLEAVNAAIDKQRASFERQPGED